MSHSETPGAPIPRLAAILATLGWLATGLGLGSGSPVIAVATLGVGILLWMLDARIAAVALTQVGVGVVAPNAPLGMIAIIESGPILLVLAVLAEQGLSIHTILTGTGFGVILSGTTLVAFVWSESVLVAAGVLFVVVATSSYAIHRYELVALGLVDGETG
ncbi:hypothetical protein [Halorhabdus sp. SVX81]|uniref:hypothetical protein n=1 Tax=Halorhabdus sp. SVX81 TaxID=2978283 RepID=UPI0023DB7B84|nr:hypothetical protein [Halorhabdus sp. SVX81]